MAQQANVEEQKMMNAIEELSIKIADKIAATQVAKGSLASAGGPELQKQIEETIEVFKQNCREGLLSCAKAAFDLSHQDHSVQLKKLESDLVRAEAAMNTPEKLKTLGQKIHDSFTWKELLHFSDESAMMLYKSAKSLFDQKHYDRALQSFIFLTTLDPAQYAFWMGLGHAAFQCQSLQLALNSYAIARMCDPMAVYPYIASANCFQEMKDKNNEILALEEAARLVKKTKEAKLEETINDRLKKLKG